MLDYGSRLLSNRVVVVTGASRGIGYAIAANASAAGADVLAVSRSGEHPQSIVGRIVPLRLDVRLLEAPSVLLSAAIDAFGRVDGLVNNAGVIYFSSCWEHGDKEWDDLLSTNLTAPFRLSQAFVRHWVDRGEPGSIVQMGSIESEVAVERQAGYAATKGGVLGLTRAMALELAPNRIRVNAIAPGVIDTGMSGQLKTEIETRIPISKLGTPDNVGSVVVFLLSDLADYVTGSVVFVDGAYSAR